MQHCISDSIYRLTLAWILVKIPQSNWNVDSSWLDLLHWSGLSLMPTCLSAPVSTVDCPCPCPVTNYAFQLLFPTRSLLASPSTSSHGKILSPKHFVWFRAKTDKGIVCLAGHVHSVTICLYPSSVLRRSYRVVSNNKKFVFIIIFTQPLRSGRIWHKVNFFKQSLTGLNSEFSFS